MKKGTFISVWDDGIEISTKATLDEKTGEIETDSIDVNGLEVLTEEKFVDKDGNESEICSNCHCHITKKIMIEGIGKQLNEITVCSDFYCDNGESNLFD